MAPLLREGDFVIISSFYRQLCVCDLVVIQHALYGCMIKKIKSITQSDEIYLQGENESSLSSRQIGKVSRSAIKGKVIFKSSKPTSNEPIKS